MLQDFSWMFPWLQESNLQINDHKSHFCVHEVEYLGYYVTQKGIKPQMKKVMAILQLAPPTTIMQEWSFAGFINFYQEFIGQCSGT